MPARVNRPSSSRAASTPIGRRDPTPRSPRAGPPRDHAADLARRAADGAEERELAVSLLDGERERARHDEEGDEGCEQGEHRQPGDGVLAAEGVVRRFRLAALCTGQDAQTLPADAPDAGGDDARIGSALEETPTRSARRRSRRGGRRCRRGRRPASRATGGPRFGALAMPATVKRPRAVAVAIGSAVPSGSPHARRGRPRARSRRASAARGRA